MANEAYFVSKRSEVADIKNARFGDKVDDKYEKDWIDLVQAIHSDSVVRADQIQAFKAVWADEDIVQAIRDRAICYLVGQNQYPCDPLGEELVSNSEEEQQLRDWCTNLFAYSIDRDTQSIHRDFVLKSAFNCFEHEQLTEEQLAKIVDMAYKEDQRSDQELRERINEPSWRLNSIGGVILEEIFESSKPSTRLLGWAITQLEMVLDYYEGKLPESEVSLFCRNVSRSSYVKCVQQVLEIYPESINWDWCQRSHGSLTWRDYFIGGSDISTVLETLEGVESEAFSDELLVCYLRDSQGALDKYDHISVNGGLNYELLGHLRNRLSILEWAEAGPDEVRILQERLNRLDPDSDLAVYIGKRISCDSKADVVRGLVKKLESLSREDRELLWIYQKEMINSGVYISVESMNFDSIVCEQRQKQIEEQRVRDLAAGLKPKSDELLARFSVRPVT